MSCKRLCWFIMFEVVVTVPIGMFIYWLVSQNSNFLTDDKMRLYLHGLLMLAAFGFLLPQAIVFLRICSKSRICSRVLHPVVNLVVFCLGVAGVSLIISYKSNNNYSHFFTAHSWCGILLLLVMIIQLIGGCSVMLGCCASSKSHTRYTPTHVAQGIGVLILVVLCIATGVTNLKWHLSLPDTPSEGFLTFDITLLNVVVITVIILFLFIILSIISHRISSNRKPTYTGSDKSNDRLLSGSSSCGPPKRSSSSHSHGPATDVNYSSSGDDRRDSRRSRRNEGHLKDEPGFHQRSPPGQQRHPPPFDKPPVKPERPKDILILKHNMGSHHRVGSYDSQDKSSSPPPHYSNNPNDLNRMHQGSSPPQFYGSPPPLHPNSYQRRPQYNPNNRESYQTTDSNTTSPDIPPLFESGLNPSRKGPYPAPPQAFQSTSDYVIEDQPFQGEVVPALPSPVDDRPVLSPTMFNPRPPSQKQIARQYRYEARRAKVEKANKDLQRPSTPPAGTYTESLAPHRPSCTSPPLSASPDGTDSALSDDVDGNVPRRGRTSYRNAVRSESEEKLSNIRKSSSRGSHEQLSKSDSTSWL